MKTSCPYCGVGCGVVATVGAGGRIAIAGDRDHPANLGRLCSKGSALAETIGLEGRLLHPRANGRRTAWEDALDQVASAFSRAIAEHGPDAVAFYVSGQLLTEDYYVANKLMKGFIGSANIDTNSRLCMASAVVGHRRAFGSDTVPGTYEDLELADVVVLVGSNLAWCHPVLYQRLAAAKERRPGLHVVLVDPRRTMTADIADLHLPIRADSDAALFSGLLAWLADHDAVDETFVTRHTTGLGPALDAARTLDVDGIAATTGLPVDTLARFYDLFARTEKVVTVFSQGANQSSRGTDKVNAILNCHLATGRIGRPGMGPFSVTGQPNAMGGREVGGLATMLAAHMEIERADHRDQVQRFWRSPAIAERAGLKAVDLFRAVGEGRIKALWIMGTNPVASLPESGLVEAAIAACPFVAVSDVVAETDTTRHAHVLLPAAAWGEKDGTVTNSERCISRQRAFLPLPGEARPDWRIICDVAIRMGFSEGFSYASPAEIFAEHAALSAFENDGSRDFDIGALSGLDDGAYDRLEPTQWPCPANSPPRERFFADGRFFTPDRRARLVAVDPSGLHRRSASHPFILNTGRVRDHWHTMTRTGLSPRLSQHFAEPYAEIHPTDGARLRIADADLVRVSTPAGSILVRALLSARQAPGSIFVPIHWTDQFASAARVDRLVPALTDPWSGQPASKHVAAHLERASIGHYGFAVVREKPRGLETDYWALARCRGGWRIELGDADADRDWDSFAATLLVPEGPTDMLSYRDSAGGQRRFAAFRGDGLAGALFLAPEPVAVSRDWAAGQLTARFATPRERLALIAGRPGRGEVERGATVCSCLGIGRREIVTAIAAGASTVDAIGRATQAGTNCGSCRAEIRGIIDAHLQAAE